MRFRHCDRAIASFIGTRAAPAAEGRISIRRSGEDYFTAAIKIRRTNRAAVNSCWIATDATATTPSFINI
nr:hypothetical protein [Chromatium okenii]